MWRVFTDGWLYPLWVVGATRMRDVDEHWPAVGSQLHHSVGVWPFTLDDTTEVLAEKPRSMLRLRARAWPGGEADVELLMSRRAMAPGSPSARTRSKGPGLLVPSPFRHLQLAWRNTEALRRLTYLVERREVRVHPGEA